MTNKEASERAASPETGGGPEAPSDLNKKSWFAVLRRAAKQIKPTNSPTGPPRSPTTGCRRSSPACWFWSRSSACSGIRTTQTLISNLGTIAPGSATSFIRTVITNAQQQKAAAGIAGIVGFAAGAVVRVGLRVSVHARGQPRLRDAGRPADLEDDPDPPGVTLFTVVCLVAGLVIVVATGAVADQLGKRARHRLDRRDGVGHREVAGPAASSSRSCSPCSTRWART